MAHEQDELALSHRLLSIAAVGFLAAAGALAFGRVYQGHATTLKLVAAALLSVGVAALLERRGPIIAVIGSGVGLLLAATFLVFPKTAAVIFPTGDTFAAIGRALHHVGEQARVQVAPTRPLQPLLLAGLTAVWTAAFAAHALAIRSGSPLLAALPPASLLAFADILLADGARPSYAALFLAAALAVLFMDGLRRVGQWGPLRPWPGTHGKRRLASTTATRGARRVTAFALGAALLIPGVLPGFQSPALLQIDTSRLLSSPTVNPLVSVTASLRQSDPVDLFLVKAKSPAYWRWMALDRFDGTQWTASDLKVDHGSVIPAGGVVLDSPIEEANPGVKTVELDQTVVVLADSPDSPWLPMAFHPFEVQVGESSIRYDEDRAAAVPEVGVQQGLSYTVRSQLVLPTPKELDQVTDFSNPAYAQYERLPADTPAAISTIAREVTRGAITPFQKLLAIQEYLHGFRYDQRVSGSQDIRSLVHFLTVTKRGFCQQFSTAMAVLARALGYPARVAVGFTPGTFDAETGAWRVSTRNAHAWVEVLFPGYGWMAFEPTPNRDNPVADNYLRQNSTRLTPCQLQGTCGSETGGTKGTAGGGDRTKSLSGRLKDREQQSLGGGGPVGVPGSPTRAPSHPYRLPLLLLGLILALGAGLFLVLVPLAKIVGRRVRLARAGPPRQVVLTAYRTFAGRAGDVGLGKADGETIREYRDRLRAAVRFSNGDLERLSSITAKAAYSVEEISKEQAKDASAAARKAIHDVRRSTSAGTRLVGMFRPGI